MRKDPHLNKSRAIMPDHSQLACPLCNVVGLRKVGEDRIRPYYRCASCDLMSVPPAYFLSPEAERARYDRHQNRPNDPRYRRFLSRLFDPMRERLDPQSRGLDFGCGPGPTLSLMFAELGHTMAVYDPFYANDTSALAGRYDFITASEVVEHLRRPREEVDRLWSLLRPGGLLGIMTQLIPEATPLTTWRYTMDDTHIGFFSRATFTWLAAHLQADLTFAGPDVMLLMKTGGSR